MLDDSRLRRANALMLKWHAGASTIGFEAFQSWGLATLRTHLKFDGVVWGLMTDAHAESEWAPRINSAHWQGLPDETMEGFEDVRALDLTTKRPAGQVTNICVTDPIWQGHAHAAMRDHALKFGLANSMSMRFSDVNARAQQFILLTRKSPASRFAGQEVQEFGLVAPHLMQAFAICRRLFLDDLQHSERRAEGMAVALVDGNGIVQDRNLRFAPMLRREWSDWPGERLPEPLHDLALRHAGRSWRFLGAQVSADFEPIEDLYLIMARPRRLADALTTREGEVAQRYAAGENFREIAASLSMAPATVRSHLRNVFGKLKVRNKSQLAASLR